MAGKIPAFFLPVTGKSTKEVAAGSALPGHAGHGLVVFQLCGLSVVCGLCRASILAGLALMQGYASPLRSPGPSFPSAVISGRSPAQVSRPHPATPVSRVRQAAASLAPLHPRLFARLLWRHGTARCRGICEQRRKTSCNMRNLSL